MRTIIDFGKSLPTSFSQSASLSVISVPDSMILGQFGVNVGTNGSVQLQATVGLQNSGISASDVILTIKRNGMNIYMIRSSSPVDHLFDAVSIAYVDTGIPAGYTAYALTVSSISSVNPPSVIGPIIFSGLSIV
ncbi:hypothetical protein GCM10010912_15050 [Paenibacillus albidus]|uniref:Exosporium protein C n=1 Tax=Paenibacillus albidus TaxID=2041023 RepID=A0A917C5D5_9BACL|nr:hypothetical protein [Paenibacillus albidus]GGF70822.1 hypothetical protein GCM10010912_15050 [Paenibacillus albidus]